MKTNPRHTQSRDRLAKLLGLAAPPALALLITGLFTLLVLDGQAKLSQFEPLNTASPESPQQVLPEAHTPNEPPQALRALASPSAVPSAEAGQHPEAAALCIRATLATGEPVADMLITVIEWSAAHPLAGERAGTTDERGEAHFNSLSPGPLSIGSASGAAMDLELAAGESREVELTVPQGGVVSGLVLDQDGNGVEAAAIWLSDFSSRRRGRIVAHTNAAGRFQLNHVGTWRSLSAQADGYLRSGQHALPTEPGEEAVVLRLSLGGGRIEGLVSAQEGGPVAEARVWIGGSNGWPASGQHVPGSRLGSVPPLLVLTDEQGRFAAGGLPLGSTDVHVRAEGHSVWQTSLHVVEDTLQVHAQLAPEARVAGVASDSSGRGLPNVAVCMGRYGDPDACVSITGQDGSYVLTQLPSQRLTLSARLAGYEGTLTEILGVPGQTTQWDPVLAPLNWAAGRVVCVTGNPLPDCALSVVSAADARELTADVLTDENGEFHLDDLPARSCVLLYPPGQILALDVTDAVLPGSEQNVIVVDHQSADLIELQGRVVDANGFGVADAELTLQAPGSDRALTTRSQQDGVFRFVPICLGHYELTAAQATRTGRRTIHLPSGSTSPQSLDDLILLP